jgi:hypothetical protein
MERVTPANGPAGAWVAGDYFIFFYMTPLQGWEWK